MYVLSYLNQLPRGTLFIGFRFSDFTCSHLLSVDFTSNILLLCLRVSYELFYGLFSSFVSLIKLHLYKLFFCNFCNNDFPFKRKEIPNADSLAKLRLHPVVGASAYFVILSAHKCARAAYSNINSVKHYRSKKLRRPFAIQHSTSHHLSPGFYGTNFSLNFAQ